MITSFLRRGVPLLVLAACVSVLVRRAAVPSATSDTWFHLRFGSEFASGSWSLSSPGHLGAFDSADWVPTQWLPQIAMYAIESRAGVLGVVFVATVICTAIVLGLYALCRREGSPLAAVTAVGAAWLAMLPSLSARPQILSYACMIVVVASWRHASRTGRVPWWLVPLTWVWVTLHGMWVLGIVVSAVSAASIILDRRASFRHAVALVAVPALSAVVALLTPVGLGAYGSLFSVGSRGTYFAEWNVPDLLQGTYVGLTALLAIVVVAGLRGSRWSWFDVGTVALAGAFAVWSERSVPVAAILLAPLAARAVQQVLPKSAPLGRVELTAVITLGVVLIAVLAVRLPGRDTRVVPDWVDQELAALSAGTPVLTSWNTGTYFLWHQPQIEPVMHGYGDVFTDAEIERNATIAAQTQGWRDEVAALDVDLAVVEAEAPLATALVEDAGWSVVREDDEFRILAPPGD